MVNEYMKIVLLKGLEHINDYYFNVVKSLLAHDLGLTTKMQDEYNRIKIAHLIEEKFQGAACVNKLIELLKDIPEFKGLFKKPRKEKQKVEKNIKSIPAKGTTPVKKRKQEAVGLATLTPTTSGTLTSEGAEETPVKKKKTAKENTATKRIKVFQEHVHPSCPAGASTSETTGCPLLPQISSSASMAPPNGSSEKPRLKAVPKEASREEGFQRGPKEVMVLKATEPFAYAVSKGERKMFHATVATESQFFQGKVFDISLKEKFIPKKVIAISDYVGCNGYLEVYNALSVSDVNADQKMEVSKSLIANANATPKISHLYLQAPGTFVNGMYEVNQFIYYEIKDNTGKIEVRMYGRLTQINCEEGNKLKLICFELALSENKWQLRSVIHSFIKTHMNAHALGSFQLSGPSIKHSKSSLTALHQDTFSLSMSTCSFLSPVVPHTSCLSTSTHAGHE
uniref:Interferon gamma inducible protein 16 n=1 Tax=Equus caballus TaxID=9796 RepID=A0A3Q2H755_HORSE